MITDCQTSAAEPRITAQIHAVWLDATTAFMDLISRGNIRVAGSATTSTMVYLQLLPENL